MALVGNVIQFLLEVGVSRDGSLASEVPVLCSAKCICHLSIFSSFCWALVSNLFFMQ